MEYENNCGGIDNILEGDGCKVDEELIRGKFDEFGNLLNKHEDRITKIEVTLSAQSESLKYVIKNQEELSADIKMMNNVSMQNYNSMLSGLNNLLMNKQDNSTKVEVAKIDSKSKVYIQIILFFGGLATISGSIYMAMK